MEYNLNFYATLTFIVCVLLLGRLIINKVKFLQDYNIPEPVVGGIIVAIGIFLLHQYFNVKLTFDEGMKNPLMLAFFTSVGLSADLSLFKKGGRILVVFLFTVTGLLFLQNITGILVAKAMGVNDLIGLLGGSISMSGGHGTAGAWGDTFSAAPYLFEGAKEVGIACATFGLVMGGIIGGPVARHLIKKHNLKLPKTDEKEKIAFEKPEEERLITTTSFLESLALFSVCLLAGTQISEFTSAYLAQHYPDIKFTLPTFVWCLLVGVIVRNVLQHTKIFFVFDREISVMGNVSLSLFLAFALMTINLSQLVALAAPICVILSAQVVLMILYAVFVTFRLCGKDYDAAVLSAGHCGFGLGATPTAIANMQTVTHHYGVSHMAFIVVPLTGAFFIDIINALTISVYLGIFF